MVGHPPIGDSSARRFDANVVVDSCRNALGAAQVALGRLNRDVAEQELNLLQLTTRSAAQPCRYADSRTMPNHESDRGAEALRNDR